MRKEDSSSNEPTNSPIIHSPHKYKLRIHITPEVDKKLRDILAGLGWFLWSMVWCLGMLLGYHCFMANPLMSDLHLCLHFTLPYLAAFPMAFIQARC